MYMCVLKKNEANTRSVSRGYANTMYTLLIFKYPSAEFPQLWYECQFRYVNFQILVREAHIENYYTI